MTICDRCRKRMEIKTPMIDFGEGNEDVGFEYCLKCRIFYVDITNAEVKQA